MEDRYTPAIDLLLSNTSVPEFRREGSFVGALTATEPGTGHTFTYDLVGGAGGDDNASFGITDGELVTTVPFDAWVRTKYSVRVRATDEGGTTAERAFTVTVTDDPYVALANRTFYVYLPPDGHVLDFRASLPTHQLNVSYAQLSIEASTVDTVVMHGNNADADIAEIFTGIPFSNPVAVLTPEWGMLKGTGYTVLVDGVKNLAISDAVTAYMSDSPGDDTLTAEPDRLSMSGPGYNLSTYSDQTMIAYSTRGGHDVANLTDGQWSRNNTDQPTTFVATPSFAKITNPVADSTVLASGFRAVNIDSHAASDSPGGPPATIELGGSAGDDVYAGRNGAATLYGPGFQITVTSDSQTFTQVWLEGGSDTVVLADTPGDDDLTLKQAGVTFSGSGSMSQIFGLESLVAYATLGGTNRVLVGPIPYKYALQGDWMIGP